MDTRTRSYIFLAGDVHGDFSLFSGLMWSTASLIDERKEKYRVSVIQLGDLGFFPKIGLDPFRQINLPPHFYLYFLPGNHDMRDILDKEYGRYSYSPIHVKNNMYYCPWGSKLELNNLKFLFLPGAGSPDKGLRHKGYDWCEEEEITMEDFKNTPSYVFSENFDYICSHTAPNKFAKMFTSGSYKGYVDPSGLILDKIYQNMPKNNKFWYLGHMHRRSSWVDGNTCFHVLDEIKHIKEDWMVQLNTF